MSVPAACSSLALGNTFCPAESVLLRRHEHRTARRVQVPGPRLEGWRERKKFVHTGQHGGPDGSTTESATPGLVNALPRDRGRLSIHQPWSKLRNRSNSDGGGARPASDRLHLTPLENAGMND
ncbi:hypothetical protein AcV5_002900 [Taiwanofungus camphoratus]|nr:hypothetical protein AcV5_002900 [Antrodia cinnamomea]